jgi:hypothetical protein
MANDNDEKLTELLTSIAIKNALDFLKRDSIPKDEEQTAFAAYCCGFYDGFQDGVKATKKNQSSKSNDWDEQ